MKVTNKIEDKTDLLKDLKGKTFLTDDESNMPRFPAGSKVPQQNIKSLGNARFISIYETDKKDTYVIRRSMLAARQRATEPPAPPEPVKDIWDYKKEILAVFPELKENWKKAEDNIKRKRCTNCGKKAQKRRIIGAMQTIYKKEPRDIKKLEGVLNDREIRRLKSELGRPADIIKDKGPRPSCLDCARKHIAQAIILMGESKLGYPDHRWLAVGHLAEASEETLGDYPELASDIRTQRLFIMDDPEYDPDLMGFFDDINSIENTPDNG